MDRQIGFPLVDPICFVDKKSFTLIEMIVVIVITGILSAIGMVTYSAIKEKAANREAKAILLLIQVAQRSYRMEHFPYFYPCPSPTSTSDITLINSNLRLSLPLPVSNPPWTISIDCSVAGSEFATAARLLRTWKIYFPAGSAEIPTCTGSPCT